MIFQKSACIETLYTELPFFRAVSRRQSRRLRVCRILELDRQGSRRRKGRRGRCGVGISGFNGDAELSLIDPAQKTAYRAFLRRSLDAAMEIGARSVTVHSNGLGREEGSFAPMTTSAMP